MNCCRPQEVQHSSSLLQYTWVVACRLQVHSIVAVGSTSCLPEPLLIYSSFCDIVMYSTVACCQFFSLCHAYYYIVSSIVVYMLPANGIISRRLARKNEQRFCGTYFRCGRCVGLFVFILLLSFCVSAIQEPIRWFALLFQPLVPELLSSSVDDPYCVWIARQRRG